MDVRQRDPIPQAPPSLLVLASASVDWCLRAEQAIAASPGGDFLVCWRLNNFSDVGPFVGLPAKLWLVDEAWVAPLLAHRRAAALEGAPSPDLIVLFSRYSSPRVVAMIESGARGCLLNSSPADEVVRATEAVLAGELWISRSVFAEVLAHVMSQLPSRREGDDAEALTDRQREIVRCVGRGMSNKQIGRHLGISPTTVKTHLHNIFQRVGVGGRTMLALRAVDIANDEPVISGSQMQGQRPSARVRAGQGARVL